MKKIVQLLSLLAAVTQSEDDSRQTFEIELVAAMSTRYMFFYPDHGTYIRRYWVTQKLPQIYTANHATFPIQIRKTTVQICGNFLVTQIDISTMVHSQYF